MTHNQIISSSILTPYQKLVERSLLDSAFDREQIENLFRLLFKMVDKNKSMAHYAGDLYLDSLIKEAENTYLKEYGTGFTNEPAGFPHGYFDN